MKYGVILCVVLLTVAACTAQADEFRGFWVDAWGAGIKSQAEVAKLLGVPGDPNSKGDIRNANCNAVMVQVRRRADVCYPSGMGEPYFSGLNPSTFNALKAVIDAAHDTTGGKQRIEVHAWIVVFATGTDASASPLFYQHNDPTDPDNYWVTLDDEGNITSDKALDPGHPRCLQYLVDVCMDLVTNFDIDGIHYDYIRFTANDQGYNPTSIARFNARYGRVGQPAPNDELFKQWRRDQVTALVRQVYARIQSVKPWVKQSGAFVTWNPSPTSSTRSAFMGTRPYYDVYSDWDSWIQEGIIDMAVPMTYYNQASLPNDYLRWMNFEKDRKGNRHMVIGPGLYLNSLQNSINQILATRTPSPAGNYCQGWCGYSYRVPYSGGSWNSFAPQLVSQVTPTPANIPPMPWKTNPTTGHISGTVTYADSAEWADGATVTITGPQSRTQICDGIGFYAFIDLPPGTYTVTASKSGYPNAQTTVNVQVGEVTGNMYVTNLELGGASAPVIFNVNATNITSSSATISWNTDQASSSQVQYGLTSSYGQTTPLDSSQVTSHVVALSGLSPNTLYHYRVISSNSNGTAISGDYTFTTQPVGTDIVVDNTDPGWSNTSPGGNNWTSGAVAEVPKIGSNYLYYRGDGSITESSITRKCRWTPNLPVAGRYDVYVYYQMGSNRNSAAPYTVHFDGGHVTSWQNQYSPVPNQGGWFLVGENLPFAAGTSGYVELTTLTLDTNLVSADAAKWVLRTIDLTAPILGEVNISPTMAAAGDLLQITVEVTDDVGVVEVIAGGIPLAHIGGDTWAGDIPANAEPGLHEILIEAKDAAENTAVSFSRSYITAEIKGLTSSALAHAVAAAASEQYLFLTWGRVTGVDGDYLDLSDGIKPVRVCCPGHDLAVGNFACARGKWHPLLDPPVLECQPGHVRRIY